MKSGCSRNSHKTSLSNLRLPLTANGGPFFRTNKNSYPIMEIPESLLALTATARHGIVIQIAWDSLNSRYDKYGIDAEFVALRKILKAKIAEHPDVDIAALSEYKPDVTKLVDRKKRLYKFEHGYNMDYKPLSALTVKGGTIINSKQTEKL